MNFKILLLFTYILIFFGCKEDIPCEKIKTGNFIYYSKLNKSKVVVERSDSIQIETIVNTGKTVRLKLFWNSPCEFVITAIQNNQKHDSIYSFTEIPKLTVKALSFTSNYYIYQVTQLDNLNNLKESIDTMYFSK